MIPTEELTKEHESILKMIGILLRIADRLETGEPVEPDDADQAVEFIRVFADKCHHGKEEGQLFPELEKAGLPHDRGPVAVMLAEHDEGRRYVEAMSRAVPGLRTGDEHAAAAFVAAARGYGDVLVQHIAKEDRVLFPMAAARLTEEQQKRLETAFKAVEETVVGGGGHEEYCRLLERLEKTYGI
jgi:hemerythrin-like domain-containing protein